MKFFTKFFIFLLIISACQAQKNTSVSYNLTITEENQDNITRFLINDQRVGPTIKATIGDLLSVTVYNKTQKELIIHWHGLIVPNNQDGVIGVTNSSIKPNSKFTYQFPIVQTGTYWYHAHGLEEAQGILGGMVLNSKDAEKIDDNLFLFTGELKENPEVVLGQLTSMMGSSTMNHNSMNHSSMMGSATMNQGAMTHKGQMTNMRNNPKTSSTMGSMGMGSDGTHYSDVTYAKHLINGNEEFPLIKVDSDKNIRLRLINAYVDGFLNFVYSGGEMIVIGSDGLEVKPWRTQNLRIAMGETYDVLIKPIEGKQLELVAFLLGEQNAYSKILIGNGTPETLSSYNYNDYKLGQPYANLETFKPQFLTFNDFNDPIKYDLSLEGNHHHYNWKMLLNGKIMDTLKASVGDKIIFTITNNTDMPHPMHLHGQFFQVKIPNQNHFLLKHTFNIDPHESVQFLIDLDKEGKWLFHCHNLFHMAVGMMSTIQVEKK